MIQPNSTQVPNHIIDELLPRLGDAEFKVLIVVTRQTIGWVEDVETGRRKDKDWISCRQMSIRTGMSERSINRAVQSLVEKNLIETWTQEGRMITSSNDRAQAGSRIFYRLATRNPSLFDKRTPAKTAGGIHPRQNCAPQNCRPTKETLLTKENTCEPAKPDASEEKKITTPKPPSVHKQFVDFWYLNTRKARRINPIITGQDGKNLQRVLKLGVAQDTLEKAAIYFLHDRSFRTFSPSLSTFLSGGVITGILNRMENEAEFWKKIESYIGTQGGVQNNPKQIASFADQLTLLKHRLAASKAMPYTAVSH